MSDTTDPDITEAPKPARTCWACHDPTEADPCECGKPSQNELAFCDVPAPLDPEAQAAIDAVAEAQLASEEP
jgi:hypothetical protein